MNYWQRHLQKVKQALHLFNTTLRVFFRASYLSASKILYEKTYNHPGADIIQQFIFPGGLLPSIAVFKETAARAGLKIINQHAFGLDYAETLRRWRETFTREQTGISALGFDNSFMRTWMFYLAYCEAGFEAGSTDVVQFTLAHA